MEDVEEEELVEKLEWKINEWVIKGGRREFGWWGILWRKKI